MKITLVAGINPDTPRAGGIQSHVLGLGRALAREGNEVTILGAGSGERTMSDDVRFIPVGTRASPSSYRFLSALVRNAKTLPIRGSLLHFQRPDDLVPFLLRTDVAARVVTVHGPPEPGVRERHGSAVGTVYRLLETLGLAAADRIVVLDKRTEAHLTERYGSLKGRLVRGSGGVDLDAFKPISRKAARVSLGWPDEPTILYLGRLALEKNVELVIKSADRVPDARVVIIGDGPLRVELEWLSREAPRIQILGTIPHAQVSLVLNAADVLVLPSHREAMPAVCLESLACGTPVVATRVGGLPDLIVDQVNGMLAEPAEDSFGRSVAFALRKSREMREACRASVLMFGWDRVARHFMQIYEAAVLHRLRKISSGANV